MSPGQDPTREALIKVLREIRAVVDVSGHYVEASVNVVALVDAALRNHGQVGATNQHDWVTSTLGHGESMCRRCKITNREAAALGQLNECEVPIPGLSSPQGQTAEEAGTPAARWREKGEPDPHAGRYDGERAELAYGHLTDDEVAHQTAMLMSSDLNHEAVLAGAKDRIRWLSRKLVAALSQPSADTGSREGWIVKPEWRPGIGPRGLNLYVGEIFVGNVYSSADSDRWLVFREGHTDDFSTCEEAQAALLSAVRPKDGGAA